MPYGIASGAHLDELDRTGLVPLSLDQGNTRLKAHLITVSKRLCSIHPAPVGQFRGVVPVPIVQPKQWLRIVPLSRVGPADAQQWLYVERTPAEVSHHNGKPHRGDTQVRAATGQGEGQAEALVAETRVLPPHGLYQVPSWREIGESGTAGFQNRE